MNQRQPSGTVEKLGCQIRVAIEDVADDDSIVVRFHSERNRTISRHSDRSPLEPASQTNGRQAHQLIWGPESPPQARDIFFPVVDIDLTSLAAPFTGEIRVAGATVYTVNSWKTRTHVRADATGRAVIDPAELEQWENWILAVGPEGADLGPARFTLCVKPTARDGRAEISAEILGNDWSGEVEVDVVDAAELTTKLLVRTTIRNPRTHDPASGSLDVDVGGTTPVFGDSRAALEEDLGLCLDFIGAAQNRTAGSPYERGLYLFYDLDARTWRTPNWTWTWGPSIRAALDAVKAAPSLAPRADSLRQFALELGELSLGVVIDEPDHPAHGMGIARWDPLPEVRRGSEKFASLADPLFLAGWAWGRLFEETGDERYVGEMRALAAAARRQIDTFGVVQQDWLFERGRWLERILDEAGFGTEGLAELYRLTDEDDARQLVADYLDPLIERLGREDGSWDRFWYVATGSRTPSECMTRGLGWAMEGMLAAYSATRNETYLASAQRMADVLISHQRSDGAWAFQYDRPVSEVGFSDKGTPLWSVLLYRLHRETGDARHLASARAALGWARSRMRRHPDDEARGGIVGIGPQSGIAYRPWFRLCCTYSTAFTANAIISELEQA